MSANPALRTVERLRRLSAGCDTPADRAWLSARLQRYLAAAPDGLRLEDALDLSAAAGRAPWWQAEARRVRDEALREMAQRFCPGETVAAQATWLQASIRRYETTAWLRDRVSASMPAHYRGTPRACLFRAFEAARVPTGLSQLRLIIQGVEGDEAADETP